MKRLWILLLGTTACEPQAELLFTEPLPVGGTELTHFPERHQGVYTDVTDTAKQLLVLPRGIVLRAWQDWGKKSPRAADSLHCDSAAASWITEWRLLPTADDSVHVLTLTTYLLFFELTTPSATRLRRKGGYYYLNEFVDTLHAWQTKRLWLRGHQAQLATLSEDSARLANLHQQGLTQPMPQQDSRLYLMRPTRGTQQRILRDTALWEQGRRFVWRRPVVPPGR